MLRQIVCVLVAIGCAVGLLVTGNPGWLLCMIGLAVLNALSDIVVELRELNATR